MRRAHDKRLCAVLLETLRRCHLHRWLTGGYAIPAAEDDSEGAAGEPSEG